MPKTLRLRRLLPFKQRTKCVCVGGGVAGGGGEQACILGSGQAARPTLRQADPQS